MDRNESDLGQGGRETAFWRVRVNQADSPNVFSNFCSFSALLPEDIAVWTISDRSLHTHMVEHKPGRAAKMV